MGGGLWETGRKTKQKVKHPRRKTVFSKKQDTWFRFGLILRSLPLVLHASQHQVPGRALPLGAPWGLSPTVTSKMHVLLSGAAVTEVLSPLPGAPPWGSGGCEGGGTCGGPPSVWGARASTSFV